MRNVAFAVFAIVLLSPAIARSQMFQCPIGSHPVGGGGGMMCQCADGSMASVYGCPAYRPQKPSVLYCGNNQTCPLGTTCCVSHQSCCSAGNYCSRLGCIPIGSTSCGNGYCPPGNVCTSNHGQLGCQTYQNYAETTAYKIVKWLADNKAKLISTYEARNEKALEYVHDNEEVKNSIKAILRRRGMTAACGGNGKCTTIINTVLNAGSDYKDFSNGKYYQGTLHMVNQGSSALLSFLVPYGGNMADAINLAGSVATSYTYGFFFGQ